MSGEAPARLVAEFATLQTVREAVARLVAAGCHSLVVYSPYADEELQRLVPHRRSPVPKIAFVGGLLGLAAGALIQWGAAAILYPINIGGRPLDAWPAFGPIMFESTVAGAVTAGAIGLLTLARLPQPYNRIFATPNFDHATQDRFFVEIAIAQAGIPPDRLSNLLSTCRPAALHEEAEA